MRPVDGGVQHYPEPLETGLEALVAGPGVKVVQGQAPQPVNQLCNRQADGQLHQQLHIHVRRCTVYSICTVGGRTAERQGTALRPVHCVAAAQQRISSMTNNLLTNSMND